MNKNNCKGCNETGAAPKLRFHNRNRLARLYRKWQVENEVFNCPESVIGFLLSNGLINEDAAVKFVEKNKHTLD